MLITITSSLWGIYKYVYIYIYIHVSVYNGLKQCKNRSLTSQCQVRYESVKEVGEHYRMKCEGILVPVYFGLKGWIVIKACDGMNANVIEIKALLHSMYLFLVLYIHSISFISFLKYDFSNCFLRGICIAKLFIARDPRLRRKLFHLILYIVIFPYRIIFLIKSFQPLTKHGLEQ